MKKTLLSGFLAITIAALAVFQLQAAVQTETVNYLQTQVKDAWVVMALKAAGQNVSADGVDVAISKATDIERTIMGAVAGGANPYSFKGTDLVKALDDLREEEQIGDEALLNDDIWGIIAYLSAGVNKSDSRVSESRAFLIEEQNEDGGWGYSTTVESDSNDTAIAIVALLKSSVSRNDEVITDALAYLQSLQRIDGGMPISAGFDSDTASTAWVISALQAAGINANTWQRNGNSLYTFLQTTFNSTGSYRWKPSDASGSPVMTAYAAIALAGTSYPVAMYSAPAPVNPAPNNPAPSNPVPTNPAPTNPLPANPQSSQIRFRFEGKDGQFCQGDINVKTALELVEEASKLCDFNYVIEQTSFGPYVKSIGRDEAAGEIGWLYLVNWQQPSEGAATYQLQPNDYVTWYYGRFDWLPLRLSVHPGTQAQQGVNIEVKVEEFADGTWRGAANATVSAGADSYTTDVSGFASLNIQGGSVVLQAAKEGRVRSQAETVVVGNAVKQTVPLKTTIEVPPSQAKRPSGGSGGGSGTVKPPQLSFKVLTPDAGGNTAFGLLKPGQSSTQNLILRNEGNVALNFTSTVTGHRLFVENLKLDDQLWSSFKKRLQPRQQNSVNVKLDVPANFAEPGDKTGELIFWAMP